MQDTHSSKNCFTVLTEVGGLDGNTLLFSCVVEHKHNDDPASFRLRILAVKGKRQRAKKLCLQTRPGKPILHSDDKGMLSVLCVSLVFVYISKPLQKSDINLN